VLVIAGINKTTLKKVLMVVRAAGLIVKMVETADSVLWVESVSSVILAETMKTMTRIGLWTMILRKKELS